jgi:hypothetical protein
MTWDQIELKWNAMAKRVGSDRLATPRQGPEEDPPSQPPGDLPQEPNLPEMAASEAH